MAADGKDDLPVMSFASAAEWDAWMAAQGDASPGAWLAISKRGVERAGVTYDDALVVALRHGWIDSQKRGLDDRAFLQRFTPRRRTSRWSQRNREIAEGLIDDGRMEAAGMAQIEAARADGRWERAYAGAATATVPADLREALDADPAAAREFAVLDGANRYAILYRVEEARRADTRARRIATFVAMLARGERIHE